MKSLMLGVVFSMGIAFVVSGIGCSSGTYDAAQGDDANVTSKRRASEGEACLDLNKGPTQCADGLACLKRMGIGIPEVLSTCQRPAAGQEGARCGTIAGLRCNADLSCKLTGTFPDAPGTCTRKSDGSDGGAANTCGASFPTFEKACVKASDCVVEMHQLNCCGTQAALGITKSGASRFKAAEKVCDAQFPKCGCATQQPKAEDGTVGRSAGDFVAKCVNRECTTTAQKTAREGQVCSDLNAGDTPCETGLLCLPPTGVGIPETRGTCQKPGTEALGCGNQGQTFPAFDKSCTAASDCAVAVHQLNCCGSQRVVGVSKASKSAFDASEKTCSSTFPACGCAAFPLTAEDGNVVGSAGNAALACVNNVCVTSK